MWSRVGRWVVGVVLVAEVALTALFPAAPAAADLTPEEKHGKVIYLLGESSSGGEIAAVIGDPGVEVPASILPCAACHGEDGRGKPEGGLSPSDLTWKTLTQPYGQTHPSGRRHPPYTENRLKRAITMGIDPAGNSLHVAMPRYRLTHEQAAALVAYIQRLGEEAVTPP